MICANKGKFLSPQAQITELVCNIENAEDLKHKNLLAINFIRAFKEKKEMTSKTVFDLQNILMTF
jgi:hypothetical protein